MVDDELETDVPDFETTTENAEIHANWSDSIIGPILFIHSRHFMYHAEVHEVYVRPFIVGVENCANFLPAWCEKTR